MRQDNIGFKCIGEEKCSIVKMQGGNHACTGCNLIKTKNNRMYKNFLGLKYQGLNVKINSSMLGLVNT